MQERLAVAKRCDAKLDLSAFTVVIDDIKDTTNLAYAAFPDRLYLVDGEGRIAYAGGRGPHEFFPNELEDSIREQLEMEPIEREEEPRRRGAPPADALARAWQRRLGGLGYLPQPCEGAGEANLGNAERPLGAKATPPRALVEFSSGRYPRHGSYPNPPRR